MSSKMTDNRSDKKQVKEDQAKDTPTEKRVKTKVL
jgi:hypothetical protein